MHESEDREKLLNRVRRIRGQVEAIAKALTANADCKEILHLITASRGALDSLLFEVLEEHIRGHIIDPEKRPSSEQAQATQELIEVLRTLLK